MVGTTKMLTVAIDAVFMLTPQPGGYRTYTTNLVNAIARSGSKHQYHLLVDSHVAQTLPANWQTDLLRRKGSLGFVWREQVQIPIYAANTHIDLIHIPGATGPVQISVPLVVTIHDTIEFTDPLPSLRHTKLWAMRLYSRLAQARAVHSASHVITVSEYSKRQIVSRFGLPPEKVTVIYNAASPLFCLEDPGTTISKPCNKYRLSGFVLGIASLAPRKNVSSLLAAYASLPISIKRSHPLLLVCTHSAVMDALSAEISFRSLDDSVLLLQGVTDQELVTLYQAAGVFVFPSLEEGFGLPPLEAMTCGTPVIALNTSSLPEVCGDAAILLNPGDTVTLADAMASVLSDSCLADTLRARGLLQSRKFSWDKTAQQTIAVYESI